MIIIILSSCDDSNNIQWINVPCQWQWWRRPKRKWKALGFPRSIVITVHTRWSRSRIAVIKIGHSSLCASTNGTNTSTASTMSEYNKKWCFKYFQSWLYKEHASETLVSAIRKVHAYKKMKIIIIIIDPCSLYAILVAVTCCDWKRLSVNDVFENAMKCCERRECLCRSLSRRIERGRLKLSVELMFDLHGWWIRSIYDLLFEAYVGNEMGIHKQAVNCRYEIVRSFTNVWW